MRELLQRELDVADEDVYVHTAPLDLGGLWSVHALDRPDLKDPPYQRVTPTRLANADGERVDVFDAIRRGDVLVTTPTRASAPRSRSSCARPRPTGRSWPSR